MIIELSSLNVDPCQPLRRDAPRPLEHQQPGYAEAFDDQTALYDCFLAPNGRHLICIGAPLFNLERRVVSAVRHAFGRRWFTRLRIRRLDRNTQIWLRPQRLTGSVAGADFVQTALQAQPGQCDLFRGKRVLLTRSKDNDLSWIRDWVTFHVVNHGCNAALLYDNASTRYGIGDVSAVLAAIDGLDTALVVGWPYKWGPAAGPSGLWDSDFSQYGALEHARWRFLAAAEAVLNADIDELVVTDNRESIFDLVARSATGYLHYHGVWIENATVDNEGTRLRHSHYRYVHTAQHRTTPKWVVAPARCPPAAQWCVHEVTTMTPDALSAHVRHRHFKAISTNWKIQRFALERPGAEHQLDEELLPWLACIR